MRVESKSAGRQVREDDQAMIDELQWGRLRDWMELVRLPALFTLISNGLAAAILATGSWEPVRLLIPAMLASIAAYWAGMILNDVVDVEEDREHRPTRPLAAGRISPVIAGHVGNGLLLFTPLIILVSSTFYTSKIDWSGAGFLAALLLVSAIRLYNSPLKETPLGPFLMGACRALNIVMVGGAVGLFQFQAVPPLLWYFAAAVGVYVLGVTVYARQEHGVSSQIVLVLGLVLEIAGLGIIASLPRWDLEIARRYLLDPQRGYPLLVGLIGLTVMNRGFAGVVNPNARKVQLAVRHALLTLILIDAAVVWMFAGPWFGVPVALLLVFSLASMVRFRTT